MVVSLGELASAEIRFFEVTDFSAEKHFALAVTSYAEFLECLYLD